MVMRSIFSENQVSGGIALVSTMIVFSFLEEINADSTFILLFFGALFGLMIGSIDPLRIIFFSFISKPLETEFNLDKENVGEGIRGIHLKKLIDYFVSRIYIIVGLLIGIVLGFTKDFEGTPLKKIDFSDIGGSTPSILLNFIYIVILILLVRQLFSHFNDVKGVIANAILFDQYRKPMKFGFEWIENRAVRNKATIDAVNSRKDSIVFLEGYLNRYDYKSFSETFELHILLEIDALLEIILQKVLGGYFTGDDKHHSHFRYFNDKFRSDLILLFELGAYIRSINHYKLIEKLNLFYVDYQKQSITKDTNELLRFLNMITHTIKGLDINFGSISPDSHPENARKLKSGSSRNFEIAFNEIQIQSIESQNGILFQEIFKLMSNIDQEKTFKSELPKNIDHPVIMKIEAIGGNSTKYLITEIKISNRFERGWQIIKLDELLKYSFSIQNEKMKFVFDQSSTLVNTFNHIKSIVGEKLLHDFLSVIESEDIVMNALESDFNKFAKSRRIENSILVFIKNLNREFKELANNYNEVLEYSRFINPMNSFAEK